MAKDRELEEKRRSKGTLWGILTAFACTVVCVVFAVWTIWQFRTGWVARHALALSVLVGVFFLVYYLFCTLFLVFGKALAFRLTISGYLLISFFLAVVFALQRTGFFYIVQSPDRFEAYLAEAGGWMPLVYILLQYLQVVILPIPGFVSTAAGVALFGPFNTTLYSVIGVVAGSFTAFAIGRKFGYKAVAWAVGKEALDKWLKKVKGKDNFILTAMFVLPVFPDDILCFVAGLSSMTWRYFSAMIVLSRIAAISATCYSVGFIPLNTGWGIAVWAAILLAIAFSFWFLYRNMDKISEKLRKKRK